MTDEMRMTTLNTSVGADDGRSLTKCTGDSITDEAEEIKSFEEWQRELRRLSDPSYLKTVSMTELFDSVYQSRPPIIDGLLCRGTYLFVGAPKLGKSFLMAQIAYHVSTGTPLWGFPVRQGTVLYLALEDDFGRLQERLYRMFGTAENGNLFFEGRIKNLIILANGENVSPEELEEKLYQAEGVLDAVVCEKDGKITAELFVDRELIPDVSAAWKIVSPINRSKAAFKQITDIVLRDDAFEKTRH